MKFQGKEHQNLQPPGIIGVDPHLYHYKIHQFILS
jgi:hypothetical protein